MYYEVRTRATYIEPNEKTREKTESFVVGDCGSFTDAEKKVMDYFDNTCEVIGMKRSRIMEFTNKPKDGDSIFLARVADVFVTDSGKEKETNYFMGIWAPDIKTAHAGITEYLRQGYGDIRLKGISQTKFIDVV